MDPSLTFKPEIAVGLKRLWAFKRDGACYLIKIALPERATQ